MTHSRPIPSAARVRWGDGPVSRRSQLAAAGVVALMAALTGWARQVHSAAGEASSGSEAARPMTGRAPAIFVGHGSPMNAIQSNRFTHALGQWGEALGKPKALLVVSAHWLTERETQVSTTAQPPLIYDFGGFPRALFEVKYPAPGAPYAARKASARLAPRRAGEDPKRGLDHGTWTVLRHLYPAAEVPVCQLSVDITRAGPHHVALGRALASLRDEGIMIVGSGNVVHNLRILDESLGETERASTDWAQGFDAAAKQAMDANDLNALAAWERLAPGAAQAVPFPDHYFPLLYAAGAAQASERARHVFEGFQEGTLSMRCVQWG